MRRIAAPLLLLVVATGVDTTSAAEAPPAPQCRTSGDYVVVSRDRADATGQDIYVAKPGQRAAGAACSYRPKPGDLQLGRGGDRYVSALLGPILALDSGTGPDRSLQIYDLSTRKKLVDTAYDDVRKVVAGGGALTYWRVAAKPVGPSACPAAWRAAEDHAELKRVHRSYEVRFSLADRIARDTGASDCVALQADM